MSNVLTELTDLHKQATTEHSHFYVAKCVLNAISEIQRLNERLDFWKRRADQRQITINNLTHEMGKNE